MLRISADKLLLTPREVAYYFGLSMHTLMHARRRPNLSMPPRVMVEGRPYYDLDDLLDWLCARLEAKAKSAPVSAG